MDHRYDVCIVGGSLVGPLLGLALAQYGMKVCIVDASPAEQLSAADFDGRAYALSASSVKLLQVLGLWSEIADMAEAMTDIKVSDGTAGQGASPLYLHFDHAELEYGPFGYMIEDRYLRAEIARQMKKLETAEVFYETQVTGLSEGAVQTARAGTIHADLVIGCDGRRSSVARFAGIDRMGWDYDQCSVVCAVHHERPHHGVAHQFFTPSGPLAILPLPGNRCSIVWTESADRARDLVAAKDQDFLNALRPVFGSFLGDLTLEGKRFAYPLGLSLANTTVAPGVALAGDAAHGIHPLAGQGLNLGVRDVAALAEVLVDAKRRGEFVGAIDVLERYQRWRRFDTAGLAMATDGINRLFSNDNPILRAGRDLGLAMVANAPGLRRGFMREAAGLTGDMPRLLQGLSL